MSKETPASGALVATVTGEMGGTQNIVALVVGATGIAGRGACQEIDPLLRRSPRLVAQPEASCRASAM
jgi:hypothetical protein